jgi:glycosyltransferase involved in cell wall biosynthesis
LSVLIALRAVFVRAQYVALVVADVESCWVEAISRSWLGRWSGRLLRCLVGWLVRRAVGVIYVTEQSLQKLYPPEPGTPTMIRSNVRLGPLSFGREDNPDRVIGRRLIAVGSQQSTAKGHDVAIRALRHLLNCDSRYELVLVGGGGQQTQLRQLAIALGVSERVVFRGSLSSEAVREELSSADLFVMPSRSEGLPRALIEAMAAGLPAAGSDVGGIPELLASSCLVPPDDPEALAKLIRDLFSPDRWLAESKRNRARVQAIVEATRPEHLRDFLGQFVPQAART